MKSKLTCEHLLHEGGMCDDCNVAFDENPMGFETALVLLKRGAKVMRLMWEKGYIEVYRQRIIFCTQEKNAESFFWTCGNDEDLMATDWVIVG